MADLEALTALHDWMRSKGVTECVVGDTRLVLAPVQSAQQSAPAAPLTPEQLIESELNDLLYSSGSDAEALLAMQRKTDERLAKRGPQ